jgi:hypothetical protein
LPVCPLYSGCWFVFFFFISNYHKLFASLPTVQRLLVSVIFLHQNITNYLPVCPLYSGCWLVLFFISKYHKLFASLPTVQRLLVCIIFYIKVSQIICQSAHCTSAVGLYYFYIEISQIICQSAQCPLYSGCWFWLVLLFTPKYHKVFASLPTVQRLLVCKNFYIKISQIICQSAHCTAVVG